MCARTFGPQKLLIFKNYNVNRKEVKIKVKNFENFNFDSKHSTQMANIIS